MEKASRVLAAAATTAFVLHAGCSGGGSKGSTINPGAGGTTATGGGGGTLIGSGGGAATGGMGNFGGSIIGTGGSGGGTLADGAVCGETETTAEAEALDLYILLDQSVSMNDPSGGGGTKWDAVRAAIEGFVDNPGNAGTRIGIGYFGIVQGGMDSCNVADYATPDVGITELPGAAGAIKGSLAVHGPAVGRFTPTAPALEGALQFAQTHAANNPDRLTVVILATDGLPTQCMPTSPSAIGLIAEAAAMGTPRVPTFVIGIGNAVSNLNTIANRGGTNEAFLIDDAADVVAEFGQALNSIATTPLACDYELPQPEDGGSTNPNLVNVKFVPGQGSVETFLRVDNLSSCGTVANGWYYDNPMMPGRIILCPDACNGLGAGTLSIAIGCATQVGPS